ncbi:MAG: RimK family alpha-L-glutamate ligase [Thermoprotei archaeon]|nr:MAG: RimK family alpha-L-glutamate ligase [Thermoprotei archaeon]
MKIGILTRNPNAWCSRQLQQAILRRGYQPLCINFRIIVARVGFSPRIKARDIDLLKDVLALIVRPIGRCSLEQAIFRMDILHRLTRLGVVVINHPSAIEKCIDKFYALSLLEEKGIPVPRTVVTESVREAMEAFYEFRGDVVVKPIFSSRGFGMTRVSDPEVARRIFNALTFIHRILYVQEFVPHGNRDIRVFVIGGDVVSAMYREGTEWKTNIAQGARPKPLKPNEELRELAIKATEIIGCEVAGVDILESSRGYLITEINSQPGWRGLQSVTKVNIADRIISYVISKVKR